MPKLQLSKNKRTSSNRFYITIPNQFVRLLGWKKGEELLVYPSKNEERALTIKEMPIQKKEGE